MQKTKVKKKVMKTEQPAKLTAMKKRQNVKQKVSEEESLRGVQVKARMEIKVRWKKKAKMNEENEAMSDYRRRKAMHKVKKTEQKAQSTEKRNAKWKKKVSENDRWSEEVNESKWGENRNIMWKVMKKTDKVKTWMTHSWKKQDM